MTSGVVGSDQSQGLDQLGAGGDDDRLSFTLVVGLLFRCLRLLRPVRWHIVLLFLGFSTVALISFPAILIIFDWFWNNGLVGAPMEEAQLAQVEAIISSMTPAERLNHNIINMSRRNRIARGSRTRTGDVNRLLKQFAQMRKMMKGMRKGGMLGGLKLPTG